MKRAALLVVFLVGCDGELRLGARGLDASTEGGSDAGAGAVKCSADAPCGLPSLHCDWPSGTCVACVRDEHCTLEHQRRCDVATHRCVECGVAADCEDDETCEPSTRRCVKRCLDGGTCSSSFAGCDTQRGICLQCSATRTCQEDDQPICDATGQCVGCTSDTHCSAATPRCDLGPGKCVGCLSPADCGGKLCDPSSNTCAPS